MNGKLLAALCSLMLLAAAAAPILAQIAQPNEAGVSIGAARLVVTDLAAHKKIWTESLGAIPVMVGTTEMLKLPNMFIVLTKGEPTAGSAGAYLDHVGISVKTPGLAPLREKLTAAGVRSQGSFFTMPDGVRLELIEEPTAAEVPAVHHLHFFVPDANTLRDWYVKTFGAAPGSRRNGLISSATFRAGAGPWLSVDFLTNAAANSTNRGRSIEGYGFEVKGLDAFVKRIQADGVRVEAPVHDMDGIKMAVVLDPIGNRIELTEGLAGK